MITSTGGMDAAGMIPCDLRVSVTGTPPSVHERLGEGQPEAHVDAALDLALEQRRVHRPADVVGGDDPRHPALIVEDDDLGRPAVGEVRHGVLDPLADGGRPVDDELAGELVAGEVVQASLRSQRFERRPQVARRVGDRLAAERRGPRRRRLAGVELALRVHERRGR